ncbi:MAG: lipid A biosynthesis lauroyl acyltransferase, partial [Bauldia sp.]
GAVGRLLPENRLAAANIAAAFPGMPEDERRRILAASWHNLARTAVEFFCLDEILAGYRADRPDLSTIVIAGEEKIGALRASGKAALFFTAHLGSGDLLAAQMTRMGLPLAVLYRPPKNPALKQRLLAWRSTMEGEWIDSNWLAPRALVAAHHRGRHVTVSVDQRVARAPVLPFLGRPAHCNDIIARLARTLDAPVYCARGVRLPDGRTRIDLFGPLDLPRDASGRVDAVAANVMIHGIIEGWVREHPDEYLWQHDRWRLVGAAKPKKQAKGEE